MTGRYAAGTEVTVQRSQQEIATTLHRYGVDTYSFGAAPGIAQVEFVIQGLPVRVTVPLPTKPTKEKGTNPATGRQVNLWTKWEQEVKEAWRSLLLLIKANLEAVERGIVKATQAFMAFLVAPDGRTVGDVILPQYEQSIETGRTLLAIEAGR